MKTIILTFQETHSVRTYSEADFINNCGEGNTTLKGSINNYLRYANCWKIRVSIIVVGRTVKSIHKSAYYGKSLFPQEMIRELNKVYTGAQLAYEMDCIFNAEFSQYPDKWVEEEETRIREKYGITQEEWSREEAYEQFCAGLSFLKAVRKHCGIKNEIPA